MKHGTFDYDTTHVLRLEKNRDLVEQITTFSNEKEIDSAHVAAIGSVTGATLAFYNQKTEEYEEHSIDEPMELLQATGNISYLEGERFLHIHGNFSKRDGTTEAGHIMEAPIFAGEAFVHVLTNGPELVRKHDPETGLTLWDL